MTTEQGQQVDHSALLSQNSGSRTFGPLKLDYTIDTTSNQATISGYLIGVSIGSKTIDLSSPLTSSIGGNVSLYNVIVDILPNPGNETLYISYKVTFYSNTISSANGFPLFHWS